MSKTIFCGECVKFMYEDLCGYGICDETEEEYYCEDKCHIKRSK